MHPACPADPATPTAPGKPALLPVFFFHDAHSNAKEGDFFAAKMAAEERHFVALSFASGKDSVQPLTNQVQLAIDQIREHVQTCKCFERGYIFVAFSQGGCIARAVIEEMDDHKVRKFISLAGILNGAFIGPQLQDQHALPVSLKYNGPGMVPSTVFDLSKYDPAVDGRGNYQYDLEVVAQKLPELQDQFSFFNLHRSPVVGVVATKNKFLSRLNNINPRDDDDTIGRSEQARRRDNFLKLEAAHLFASPDDGVVTPWQSSILGRYTELESVEDIKTTKFESLEVLDMKDTIEYRQDTYGLRTLDRLNGLHLHVLPGISHLAWTDNEEIFVKLVHPLL